MSFLPIFDGSTLHVSPYTEEILSEISNFTEIVL